MVKQNCKRQPTTRARQNMHCAHEQFMHLKTCEIGSSAFFFIEIGPLRLADLEEIVDQNKYI